jgi:alcohol dehydrogenase class IV
MGVAGKLLDVGFKEDDVPRLVKLAMTTPSLDLLLSLAPIKATEGVIEAIYKDSLKPLC